MIQIVRSEDKYAKQLLKEVPEGFFVNWLKLLGEAYRTSWTSSMDYEGPEGKDVRGHIRRARAEEALLTASAGVGLPCRSEWNKRKTSHHRVTLAGRFVIVQCHASFAGQVVRSADHRHEYSLAEGDLFEGFANCLSVPPEQSIFAILQHGEHPKQPQELGFAVVNFPAADVDRYVSTVDILSHFRSDHRVGETRVATAVQLRPKRQDRTEDSE